MIYKAAGECKEKTRYVCTYEMDSTLSQTCRQINTELNDLLYVKDRIQLEISTLRDQIRTVSAKEFNFLSVVRRVHVEIYLRDASTFDQQIEMLDSVLDRLRQSGELTTFSFHLGYYCFGWVSTQDYGQELRAALKAEAGRLRRVTTKEGVKAGRNAKERELHYALNISQMLKDVPKWDVSLPVLGREDRISEEVSREWLSFLLSEYDIYIK